MPTNVKIEKTNKGVGSNKTSSPYAAAPDATRVQKPPIRKSKRRGKREGSNSNWGSKGFSRLGSGTKGSSGSMPSRKPGRISDPIVDKPR